MNRTARDLLDDLGTTESAITNALIAEGAIGKRGSATRCPVANYLALQFPGSIWCVDACEIFRMDDRDVCLDTPEVLAGWIELFDEGQILDLDEEVIAASDPTSA